MANSQIYAIFANPFYAGVIRLRSGETYRGAHPPMVSWQEFEQVQKILGQQGRPRPQKHDFPYTGLFTCGTCGCRITAEQHIKPSGKRYVYYRCTHRSTTVRCTEPAISESDLEKQVSGVLARLTMPEKILNMLLGLLHRTFEQERNLSESLAKSIIPMDEWRPRAELNCRPRA